MVKTKIISTLGPTSDSITVLRKMMLAGLDVVRLNFSHGNQAEHLSRIKAVRNLNKKYRRHLRILQDLEGYRIRIGKLKTPPIQLKRKDSVVLSNNPRLSDKNIIPLDYKGSLRDIKKDDIIYINDGYIALHVKRVDKNYINTLVVSGGELRSNKGVNIPGIKLKFKELTDKDKKNITFGIENKVDFIAQSFVRNRKDVLNIKKQLKGCGHIPKIIAKIENEQGIKNIDAIIEESDGIMIARGDMGVSLPIYQVPIIQKMIIKKCNKTKKFVITATQMLESMSENKRPTRAEVSDVANAIIDGTDYVMLSGETAVGKYPVESVEMMNQIIKFTEKES